jgi:benzoylformate decarboxylase
VADELDAAARILRAAVSPVVVMGDGVADSGAQEELARVAELLSAPVWGACDSEVNMDATHRLYRGGLGHMFGTASRERLAGADVVLIVGTYLFPEVFPLLDSPFRPGTRIVHVDLDDYEIAKNFPVDVALAADPKATLAALCDLLAGGPGPGGAVSSAVADDERAQAPWPGEDAPLISQFAAELAQRGPADLVVFDEALTASPALAGHLPPAAPGSLHATRGGSLGVGIPGAIGVKLARPRSEVIAFTGDGGSMYTIQALWTAARYGVGARFVICDNQRYGLLDANISQYWSERGIPAHRYPGSFDLSQPRIDFPALAGSLGVAAQRVDKPGQVAGAVDRMLSHPGPFLIDLDTT